VPHRSRRGLELTLPAAVPAPCATIWLVHVRLLLACVVGLVLPASAKADSYFTVDHPVRDLDVRANHVAWSVGNDRDRDHLRGGFGKTAHDLPIPTAGLFGGIDLGTDSRGRTVLVYARCPRPEGRRCDLYLYRPVGRPERRLDSVSRRACSESKPHIDRGVLLFTRKTRRSRSPRSRCSGGLFMKRPGHRLRRLRRRAPSAYDFAGRSIAFERDIIGPPDSEPQQFDTEIRLLRIGSHRSRLVARATGTRNRGGRQGIFLGGPRLDRGFVYWQRSLVGALERDDILRRRLAGGPTSTLERTGRAWVGAGLDGDGLFSFAVNGRRLFYLFGGFAVGAPGFPIGRVDPAPVFR
jgi:hypothetical protein